MGKKSENQENQNPGNILAMALAATQKNTTKAGSGSGRVTYLDRFVAALLNENGQPCEPKSRTQVIAEMSLSICQEKRQDLIESGADAEEFTLTASGDTEDDKEFAIVNRKVKSQVASAVANNQNSTSISFNPKYKNVWGVVKEGGKISLKTVEQTEGDS